jgi:hypothetical protein
LQKLAGLSALDLSYSRYEYDAGRLFDLIQRVLAVVRDPEQADRRAQQEADSQPGEVGPDGHGVREAAHKVPEPVRNDRIRSAQLLADAERIAQSIKLMLWKAGALVEVATALAATDPDGAERIAQSITDEESDEGWKAWTLSEVAAALAATDPARAARLLADAERIAQSITHDYWRLRRLAEVATVLAATNPDHAVRIVLSIRDRVRLDKPGALNPVVKALAATDPNRAELIAQSITHDNWRAKALVEIAEALAATDPDRAAQLLADAGRIAKFSLDHSQKASALAEVAKALAATDPDGAAQLFADAEHSVQGFTRRDQAWPLSEVAAALAATDPDGAERIAQSIEKGARKAIALLAVAAALAATDPDRAERIVQSITSKSYKAWALVEVAKALAATDSDRAARLIGDAERIARSITDKEKKAWPLSEVAAALAVTDPDRAERIAQSIADGGSKVTALVRIAGNLTLCVYPKLGERLASPRQTRRTSGDAHRGYPAAGRGPCAPPWSRARA